MATDTDDSPNTSENTPIAGSASTDGTRRFFTNATQRGATFSDDAIRTLGSTGLNVSKIGYGTYRVHADVEEHVRTLLNAVLHGINLIDTSTNYTDGGSERLVGNVLRALIDSNAVARDQVVVVSKVGYVQGSNYRLASALDERGEPFAEMVKYQDGLWHCIHPDWLEDQLARTLERTQLQTLDVYLLHNPEYYFTNAKQFQTKSDLSQLRSVFYERVTEAFARMERFVEEGRVSRYGVSSNTFASPSGDWEHVSLTELLWCARRAAKQVWGDEDAHHFAVAQLPFNLFEAGAFAEDNSPDGDSFLNVAQEHGVGVLANRPLNAVSGQRLVRLAQYEYVEVSDQPLNVIAAVAAVERDLVLALKAWRVWDELSRDAPTRLFFDIGETMKTLFPDIQGREQWLQVFEHFLAPSVVAYTQRCDDKIPTAHREEWEGLKQSYQQALQTFAATLSSHFNQRETEEKSSIR
ncbi:MAG: aldo/keto reductase, partial [Candidatus Poribacteria bacterium]|nr:aldo/keto reductase [Candidatus Poribacteria bacterium]